MQVGEFCNREVVIVDRDTTIMEAAKLMRSHHVGNLVVTEKQQDHQVPVGILTDRDIVVELLAEEIDVEKILVGDAMAFELHQIDEHSGVQDALTMMRDHGIRRLPVVDAKGALVGILTMDDLLELLTEQLTDLVRLVGNELIRERSTRQ